MPYIEESMPIAQAAKYLFHVDAKTLRAWMEKYLPGSNPSGDRRNINICDIQIIREKRVAERGSIRPRERR